MPKLTIYFTSDTHGYLYPNNFASKEPQHMGLLSMHFPKDENTLIIDGGDTIQGSPLTYFCRLNDLELPVAPRSEMGNLYRLERAMDIRAFSLKEAAVCLAYISSA